MSHVRVPCLESTVGLKEWPSFLNGLNLHIYTYFTQDTLFMIVSNVVTILHTNSVNFTCHTFT